MVIQNTHATPSLPNHWSSLDLQTGLLLTTGSRVKRIGKVPRHAALCRRVGLVGRRGAQAKTVSQGLPIDLDVFSA